MTTKDWRKVLKQLKEKPAKLNKYMKHNKPKDRTTGMGRHKCVRCGRYGGHCSQYGLHLCRQCLREIATSIGFKKYS
jgi:small subunit ribosomal protein S14